MPRQLFCVTLCSWLLLAFRHTRSCLRGRVLPKSVPKIGVLASRQLMTDGQNISPKTRTNGRMLATRCRARGVDHLRVCRTPGSGKFPEQIFPDPARRTIGRRAIAPATAAFQHLHDAADDAAVVHPLDAADIRRQERLDPLPLLVAQPKQIPAHNFKSFPPKNHYLIVSEEGLMSSDPKQRVSSFAPFSAMSVHRCVNGGDKMCQMAA